MFSFDTRHVGSTQCTIPSSGNTARDNRSMYANIRSVIIIQIPYPSAPYPFIPHLSSFRHDSTDTFTNLSKSHYERQVSCQLDFSAPNPPLHYLYSSPMVFWAVRPFQHPVRSFAYPATTPVVLAHPPSHRALARPPCHLCQMHQPATIARRRSRACASIPVHRVWIMGTTIGSRTSAPVPPPTRRDAPRAQPQHLVTGTPTHWQHHPHARTYAYNRVCVHTRTCSLLPRPPRRRSSARLVCSPCHPT